MASYSKDDNAPFKKDSVVNSVRHILTTGLFLLLVDVVIYGTVIPLIGTYLGGWCCYWTGTPPKWELVVVVIFTFTLMYGTFCLVGEASFWKHLFAFDPYYGNILQMRDIVNVCFLGWYLVCLFTTVKAMIFQDKGMKKEFVSEGAGYVYLKTICDLLRLDHSILKNFGFGPPHAGTFTDPSFGENEKFEHGAAYMLYWAMLSACVAKLVYYNTLFTYLRAMEIFISMKPSFLADEDSDIDITKQSSAATFKGRLSDQSRLENDFARSVKKSMND